MPDTIAKQIKTGILFRLASIAMLEPTRADEESRRVEVAFSSEEPVTRWFGEEILSHESSAVRMDWIGGGRAPLLMDHNRTDHVGVVEEARLDGKICRAIVKFGRSARAEEILQDVRDGIRSAVSVGYRVHELTLEVKREDGDVYRATDWEPMEISLVSVPADQSVGVGRADDEIETIVKRNLEMPEAQNTATPAQTPAPENRAAPAPAPTATPAPAAPAPAPAQTASDHNERAREIAEMTQIGERFKCMDKVRELITNGSGINVLHRHIIDTVGDENLAAARTRPAELDFERGNAEQYSLMRAIDAAIKNDWSNAGFERECSAAIASATGRDPQGFFVPSNINWSGRAESNNGQRDLTVGSAAAGGNLVGTDHLGGDFITALRDRLVLSSMGVRIMDGLVGDVQIPAANATTAFYWVAENGAPTEGAPTYRQVPLSPKTVAAYVDISRKLRNQSSPAVESIVRDDLLKGIAVAIQVAAINGGGSNEPDGILNQTGIGDVAIGTNGGPIDWDTVVNLEKEVDIDNALEGSIHYLTNTKVKAEMKKTPKQASGVEGNFIMGDGNEQVLNGHSIQFTNSVPSNLTKGTLSGAASAMLFGDFSSLLIGMWGGLDLMVDPYSLGTSGGTRLTIFQDVDNALRYPQSMSACQDINAG